VNVDAIEKRAGDLGDIALNHGRGTHALAGLVVEEAAGASLRCLFAISNFWLPSPNLRVTQKK
jgi:hypothetical protein